MTRQTPHSDALKAYLNLLDKNGSKRADASLKEHFARLLISKLDDKPLDQATYRAAVDSLLESLPGDYRNGLVTVAREFFPFLISDIKSVVAMMKTGSYRGLPGKTAIIADREIMDIDDLIRKCEEQALSDHESLLHRRYIDCLRSSGTVESTIAMRGRISRMLLYLTRNCAVTGCHYRAVIDTILPMLRREEARFYFLSVAREFFYFLTEDPDAPARLNLSDHAHSTTTT